jgi:hypothetical protein
MAKPAIIQLTRHLYYNAKATPQLPLFQKPFMHRIGRVNDLKAKDFLVRRTIEQAALESSLATFDRTSSLREDSLAGAFGNCWGFPFSFSPWD